jgi:hypothetical protein
MSDIKVTLLDARKANRASPDTFHIPSPDDVRRIQVGNMVKLSFQYDRAVQGRVGTFGGERMWVRVTSIRGARFEGVLRNTPDGEGVPLRWGDPVRFGPENVLKIDFTTALPLLN